ncbi:helix-turn-helix transcriptional regulator [Agromyces allii]|uniref:helix-turn-helix transcriptional regulator n=1 Tax=Agromyces allii TaxID=393607 RepID=UPI0014792F68|nr:AAA family ATPase [Agromyces allii]
MTTSAPAMIGRDADLARLLERLDEVRSGSPFTVIIGGEAGIGKTRLVREFALSLDGEVRFVVGQCVDLGSVAAPYAPVKAALRALVADVGAERVLDVVGPGRGALTALLPELAASAGSDSSAEGAGGSADAGTADAGSADAGAAREGTGAETGDGARDGGPAASDARSRPAAPIRGDAATSQLHEAIAVLLETLSKEKPIVFVIEDLHWIDAASLAMLRFLMRVLGSSRVLTVLTYRSEDVTRGHPVRGFLAEADRDRWVDRQELSRLTPDDAMALVSSLAPDRAPTIEAAETIVRRGDGVPFLIEELIGLDGCRTDDDVPETLRDLLLARYERLGEPAQRLLRLLSIGGVRVPHALLEAVYAGEAEPLDAEALDAAAREAVLGGVLTVEGSDYAFRHALVREAILADLLPGERARYHGRYARAYETAAHGSRRLAAEISFHWLGANDAAKAFPATIKAMGEARAAAAYASAAQLGERAIGLWEVVPDAAVTAGMGKLELMGRTASYLRSAGEGERGLALVKAALDECPPDDPQYPRLLRDTGLYLANVGRPGSIPLLEQALEVLGDDGSDDLRATVLIALAGRLMIEARLDEAVAMAEQAYVAADRVGSARYASVALNIQGVSVATNGDVPGGLALLDRAHELALGDGSSLLRYWVNASDLHYLIGNHAEAVRLAEEGLARAKDQGVERSSGVLLASNAVDPLLALGEWERAERLTERALALDPALPLNVYLHRARIWTALWRGDVNRAAELHRSLRPAMNRVMDAEVQTMLGIGRVAAEIALAQGDPAEAWREVRVVVQADRHTLPGYALPFLWVAGRTIAAVRSRVVLQGNDRAGDAGGSLAAPALGSLADEVERAVPVILSLFDRMAFWPTAPLWRALFDAELAVAAVPGSHAASGIPGTDAAAWRAAFEQTTEPTSPRYLGSYALLRQGEAELAAADRAGARTTLQAAHTQAVTGGVTAVVEQIVRVASAAGIALDGVGGGAAARAAQTAREVRDARGGRSAGGLGDDRVLEGSNIAESPTADAVEAAAAVDELTTRERQVLELIAEGLSNRQIGERLYISGKTVSVHVSAILRKLGASTRAEAAFRAGVLR